MTTRSDPSPADARLRPTGQRTRDLLAARVVEQGAYGLVSLLLARWVGLDGYAPIGALLVFNSLAIVASDFGIGVSILGGRVGAVGASQVARMRLWNAALLAVALPAGLFAGGTWGSTVAWCGVIWFASAEAFVRKSALLRLGHHRRVALLEIVGSLSFVLIASAAAWGASALAVSGAALLAKHAVEAFGSRGWTDVVGSSSRSTPGTVWWTQLLSHVTANVDFVIIGALVSAESFAVYSLGYRAASLITSQISYAVGRVVMVDMAEATNTAETHATYRHRAGQLLWAGVAGGLALTAASPLLPVVLGADWKEAAWVVVILGVATPWRMLIGVTGALMITSNQATTLVRWEVARLAGTTAVLALAALAGMWPFVAAVSAVAIVSTSLYNHFAPRAAGVRSWRLPALFAPPALGLVMALALWASA